jgi:hypothetical protein
VGIPVNTTGAAMPVRPDDPVRIEMETGPTGITALTLDLTERESAVHCLVSLPAVDVPAGAVLMLWMTANYDGATTRLPFTIFVAGFDEGHEVGLERVRWFAGRQPSRLALPLPVPEGAVRAQVVLYADRSYRGRLQLTGVQLTAGPNRIGLGAPGIREPVDVRRRWHQDGRRVVCTSVFGEHWAEMPDGWRLDAVHPAALAAAEWLLYAPLMKQAFGIVERAPDPEDPDRRFIGSRTLLSYSLGTDSTAALTLLPPDTISYYAQRPYGSYTTNTGAEVRLPDARPWEERLAAIPNLIVVPNTFEQIRVCAGGRHGFGHSYGYAAIGLLLADHVDAGVIAFGSVMEQVFLRSGHLYADVVALPSSAYNSMRRLVEAAGLFFALPTGGCSEVITNRIADTGRFAGLAISCPSAAPDGTPCGVCFKCFRKLRIDGRRDLPEPSPGVQALLHKYPLKSATSVVYAAGRSAYRHPDLDRYRDVRLDFLERYSPYAVDHMLPPHLRDHVRDQFRQLGIAPMDAEDDLRLRSIGKVFWPEQFDPRRAGLPAIDGARG